MGEYMNKGAIDDIRHSIRVLNHDYTELVTSVSELRADIRWLKGLMIPVAIASLVSVFKMLSS